MIFMNLVVVMQRNARNENGKRRELVRAGNIFLLPDHSVHRYAGIKNFCHYNILFHPSLLKFDQVNLASLPGYSELFHFQFNGEDQCSQLLSVDEAALSKLVSMIETIRNETALRTPGWRESAFFEFMRMLVYLLRCCVPQDAGIGQNAFRSDVRSRLMEEDCTKPFTLKSLADEVHMSEKQLPSPLYGDHRTSAGRISAETANPESPANVDFALLYFKHRDTIRFRDNNYFSRQIRKQTGFTPREIQKNYGRCSSPSMIC